MAINRFTKYTAPQFVQAYDPYPIEKLLPLAQHQQSRFDAIDAAIGKAEAQSVITPGLSKESKETAAAINKERKQQMQDISNKFYQTRNVRQAMRDLSGISSSWANDPRVKFVESDAALKDIILKNMADPDFGTTKIYEKLNPNTGEFTLGLTPEQIAAGMTVTPETYNFISNPGQNTAFKWIHEPMQADVMKERKWEQKPDGKGGYYTYGGKALTLDTIMSKGLPSLERLSSDGIHLDQFESSEPELVKYIEFQKTKNPNYGVANLINDFAQDAKLYTYWQGFSDQGGTSSGGGAITEQATPNITPSIFSDSMGNAYPISETEIKETEVVSNFKQNGLGGDKGALVFATGQLENADITGGIDFLADKGVFEDKFIGEPQKNLLNELKEEHKKKYQNPRNNNTFKIVNGERVATTKYTDGQIEKMATQDAEKQMDVIMQIRNLAIKTEADLLQQGKISVDDLVKGVPQATKEQQKAILQSTEGEVGKKLNGVIEDLYSGNAVIVNGQTFNQGALTKWEDYSNEAFESVPTLKQAIQLSRDAAFGATPEQRAARAKERDAFLERNKGKILQELSNVEGNVQEEQWVNTPVGGTSAPTPRKVNYADYLLGEQQKAMDNATKRFSVNTVFMDQLDKNFKSAYGERNYLGNSIMLDTEVDPTRTDKTLNYKHQMLAQQAGIRAKNLAQPVDVYKDGKRIVEKEDVINSIENLPEELKNSLNFVPESFYFDWRGDSEYGRPYSVYVKGTYEAEKSGAVYSSSEKFDIDVTDQFLSSDYYLNPKEKAFVGYQDMIADKLFNLEAFENQSFIDKKVSDKMTEINNDENFNLYISKNATTGTYDINGSTVLWNPGIDNASENASLVNINNLPNKDDYTNLSLNQAKEKIIPMISDIYDAYNSVSTSAEESKIPMNYQKYQPVIDNLKATGQINNPNEIESFNVGLFGLNDRNIYQNSGIQSEIGFISADQSPIAPANMRPEQNIEFAARTVANTKIGEKNGGWNNWDVVKRKDAKFVSDVQKLQNIFQGSSKDINTLKANIEDNFSEIENASVNDNRLVDVVYSQFSQMSSYRAKKGNGTIETNINDSNIPDWMYAIAVILNESNANPDSIKANLYK
jgi:hypothetical protein